MHREISHTDEVFHPKSNLSLYFMTGLVAALLLLDLWPWIASALGPSLGVTLPSWPRDVYGWRIALVAAIIGGARTLYGSLEGLFEGKIGADVAVAIAAIAAILIGEPLVAAEVVFIGMVGEVLESVTFERTQRAIRKLVEVFPRRCWRLEDGKEVRVRTNELKPGDRVLVKPGARIPADGLVIEGRSSLDVSALTGESLPQDKGPGDEVLAGSLNQTGALTMEAKRVSEQTVMGRVIELTSKALKDKAPMERTADRLAKYFLPVVLGLAALTFLGYLSFYWMPWFRAAGTPPMNVWAAARLAVYPTLSVLVVACPCALILATPAAVIAALGRLAGTGVLLKGGRALEQLATVKAFAFDKTGTLTEGRLELGDVVGLGGVEANEVLRVAAAAEQRSEHLLARLITQEASRRQLPLDQVDEFQAHPGGGVTVSTPAGRVVVGTRRLLEEQGVVVPDEAQGLLDQLNASGQTALLVARGGVVLGAVGARDQVRPEAAGVLEELKSLGISEIALLTGDRRAVAEAVARQLNITEVQAELLPQQKAEWVARPTPTAFVGDGINDAPALARATVGLAIGGTGTDVAAEAGDVVFMGDPLRHIPLLLRLSRQTVKIIRQNILIFAFGVNAFGILLTSWLWPILFPSWYEQSPLAAVIYHQLGSLAVLLNAMRLLWFERGKSSKTLANLRAAARRVDAFMERYLNVDEAAHWLSHYWKPVLLGLGVLLLVAYGLSGFTSIGPDEVGVVRQFGKVMDDDLTPGLHYRWPWPVETVTRLQPDRVRTVEVGFRTVPGAADRTGSLAWASAHGDAVRRVPEEAVMITGDGNLVEMQATVRYTISEPHAYLFEVGEPEEVLRGLTESVLRETVAGSPFLELLTVNREEIEGRVLARVAKRLAEWSGHADGRGIGVKLEGVSLQDLHPPQEVVAAYHEVTMAMEARDRQVNQARAEALYKERESQAKAEQIRRSAQASKVETVKEAEAAQAVFLARLRARTQLPVSAELRLLDEVTGPGEKKLRCLGELLVSIVSGRPPSFCAAWCERRKQTLESQALLTDFRLFWDAMGGALAGREKLLVDADKVPGKRQLLLFDPEMFRVPVPFMSPSQRGQPSRGEEERGP